MKGNIENSHNESPTLHRIANTILCNYSMTTTPNLVNGRMGVCLFLYEYARLTGIKEYEDIADEMIDLIFKVLRKGQNEDNISSLSGIGIGIIYLITHQFLEDTDEHDSLEEVDKYLQQTVETAETASEMVVQAALYFIYRYLYYRTGLDEKYFHKLAEQLVKLFQNSENKGRENEIISNFILQNVTLISDYSQNEEKFHNGVIPSSEIVFNHNQESITAEKMWYSFLFSKTYHKRIIDDIAISDLCRNCFYDADRTIGILSCIGLIEMSRGGKQQWECPKVIERGKSP